MQICMMTNTYLPHVGGVARSVETFTEKYREKGQGTLVVAPTFPNANRSTGNVIRLPAIQNFNGSDFSVRLPIPGFLYDAMEEFGPNLIHSHHPFLIGDTAVRVARQWEVPLVFTHHTLYERYTHYVPFDSSVMRDLVIKLATGYANLCSLVIAPSESIEKLLRSRGVESPIEVVPTGVDVASFQNGNRDRGRSTREITNDQFVVGHVGRLAYEKNLVFLSTAVAQFLHQHHDARFLVVGDGKARDRMINIFEHKGVANQVIMTGKLTGDDLADAYRAMDLFAFASTSETQGMVVAEAMAASLPVIALDASGVREVVVDDMNGCLLDADADTQAFADAIDNFMPTSSSGSGDKAADMSKKALETARKYDIDRCVDKMLGHYEKLCSDNSYAPAAQTQEGWKRVLNGIAAEWELLAQKATSLSSSSGPAKKKR